MLTVALVIIALLWRLHGGLALACAMWILAFFYLRSLPPRLKSLPVAWFSVLFGMVCNALVIISNGGLMPVVGVHRGLAPLLCSWTLQGSAHHFTILADQAALNYCSIGDVFVLSGAVLWCIGPSALVLLTNARKLLQQRTCAP